LSVRRLISIVHDLVVTALALFLSFLLRWGTGAFWAQIGTIATVVAIMLPAAALVYWLFRLDRSPWRFVSIGDVPKIAGAASVVAVLLVVIDFMSGGALLVPRTVPVIYWFVQVFFLLGSRLLYRAHRHQRQERRAFQGVYRTPVLIAGTGDEAVHLIRRVQRDTADPMEAIGLLSHKRPHVGERFQGIPVLGLFSDLEEVVETLQARGVKPRRLIITRESLKLEAVIDHLLADARRLGLTTVRPSEALTHFDDVAGAVQLAPISIEDLLGRSTRDIDVSPLRELITGRRVLVTGAGGSIGSELSRQIAAMEPARLLLLDHSELALYTIAKEIRHLAATLPVEQRLGSVTDRDEIGATFEAFKPDLVFHAAALKHVDIVEGHPLAAANTNAVGTRHVADAAAAVNAICAVFISTDKAVNPVSILGATKRAAELYWAASDRKSREAGTRTRFLTVRFGNVLGSSGSVIPLFREQLSRGGPLTVTHPEVERYFMTISEAVTLVLMASALGVKTAEISPTYVLDMGEPVRILDLARRMIRLAGLEPDRDIDILFTGLRPGERLKEALEYLGEDLRGTSIPGVRATDATAHNVAVIEAQFAALERGVTSRSESGVQLALRGLVAEYERQPDVPAQHLPAENLPCQPEHRLAST
jgi:FlaA1/EpsC-like NDP-sugar epimerase